MSKQLNQNCPIFLFVRRLAAFFLLAFLIFTQTACSGNAVESSVVFSASQPVTESGDETGAVVNSEQNLEITSSPISVDYDQDDLDSSDSSSDMSYINMAGDTILFEGSGASVDSNIVTITSAGMYSISGFLNDGQILVDTDDEEKVVLVLNGADITNSSSAPIYIRNAEKIVITLADGTENVVTDGDSYIFEDAGIEEPNAAIFSNDDLTINGNGSLTVNANYNNGITSQDDLKMTGGRLTVNAVNDGIKGRDSIAVKDGMITINAGGDGMQSNNAEDVEKGYISIEGGTFNITAGLDGIQAETRLMISDGDITISSGGGSINSFSIANRGIGGMNVNPNDTGSTISYKGMKAGIDVTITGGTFIVDSSDDSIHSNNSITINSGEFLLASGDDAIHSDTTLVINNGNISITKSYEGIESADITINGGNIYVASSDDGINAIGGNAGTLMTGRQGQFNFNLSSGYNLYVNGETIVIDTLGDGLDINGTIDMSGGVVIIHGPTTNFNGALDYFGMFNITGGFLVAVGSAGMAQAPSNSSTQYSVMHTFSSPQATGTMVHIEAKDGEEILTFMPTKAYQSVVLSSPDLKNGATYMVYTGGSSTGTVSHGLYSGGAYTAGAQVNSFTISGVVTGAGSAMGGFPSGPGGDRRPPRP